MPYKGKQAVCSCGHSRTKHYRHWYKIETADGRHQTDTYDLVECKVKGCACKKYKEAK